MVDILLIFLVLVNLTLLGMRRVGASIRLVAIQGFILGVLSLLAQKDVLEYHSAILVLVSVLMKAFVFPWLLQRSLREVSACRDAGTFVGQGTSLIIGTLALAGSLWLGTRLPLNLPVISGLLVPVALFTILTGFFVIVTRKQAITQVLGYLALENGIYAFGITLAHKAPVLIEMAILLDVFVAVFVMGIAIFQINRTFDHIDTDQLSNLKD
jgi:hydrogenase-4 component E